MQRIKTERFERENKLKNVWGKTKSFLLTNTVLWNEESGKMIKEIHDKQEISKIDREIKKLITEIYYKRNKLIRTRR